MKSSARAWYSPVLQTKKEQRRSLRKERKYSSWKPRRCATPLLYFSSNKDFTKDKRIENARISAAATGVLKRLRDKAPELVSAFTFDDVNKDYIKHEMLKLYNHDHATIGEKTRLLELMGKTQAMFTDKIISDTKIREVVEPIYTESAEDFPERLDERKGRIEIEDEEIEKV